VSDLNRRPPRLGKPVDGSCIWESTTLMLHLPIATRPSTAAPNNQTPPSLTPRAGPTGISRSGAAGTIASAADSDGFRHVSCSSRGATPLRSAARRDQAVQTLRRHRRRSDRRPLRFDHNEAARIMQSGSPREKLSQRSDRSSGVRPPTSDPRSATQLPDPQNRVDRRSPTRSQHPSPAEQRHPPVTTEHADSDGDAQPPLEALSTDLGQSTACA
jgi:hypothetical protein